MLLLDDAWFDVVTAGRAVVLSLTPACVLELPLAILCAVTALRPPGMVPVQAAVAQREAAHV
ncbi:hypothetical protein [Streptomyces aureocirculatus]|uniref:hypothetical protein n=1 Tax=Streptomyces aureocirculatus TaxID=67275 RepID=UPI001470049F|nr:hypothetical protein [Streptomyces aureocirculatus]